MASHLKTELCLTVLSSTSGVAIDWSPSGTIISGIPVLPAAVVGYVEGVDLAQDRVAGGGLLDGCDQSPRAQLVQGSGGGTGKPEKASQRKRDRQ